MNYYCSIVGYNSPNQIITFRPKIKTKSNVWAIAKGLQENYKFVFICHNTAKASCLKFALSANSLKCGVSKIISVV